MTAPTEPLKPEQVASRIAWEWMEALGYAQAAIEAAHRHVFDGIPLADLPEAVSGSTADLVDAHEFVMFVLERVPPPRDPAAELRAAAQRVLAGATDTYKARNGRQVGIEAADGEKCLVVHSEDVELLRAALAASEEQP
ncbi:MAG: hypothetical protein WDA03_13360 [Trueperaceae bacterium]